MAKSSKRFIDLQKKVVPGKAYAVAEALTIVKTLATAKFDESVDVSINLGIDARKSDQMVRGSTVLPSGTGKTIRVAVFAQGSNVKAAEAAGADVIGWEDLAEAIKGGQLNFDMLIATPDAMRIVSPLGTILGPRGLMPNPKVGTVTTNVELAVKNAKGGQVTYRTDKNGIIHCNIGKASFTPEQLKVNLEALLADLKKARPASAKGVFFKKLTLSSTMGAAIGVDLATLNA